MRSPTGMPSTALDRKSTRLNSSHMSISYAVFCLKKKTCLCRVRPRTPPRTAPHPRPPFSRTLRIPAFSFIETPTAEIYTLSLHDALPILATARNEAIRSGQAVTIYVDDRPRDAQPHGDAVNGVRSEEHTSELQSHVNLVCRLLLEKKNVPVPGPSSNSPTYGAPPPASIFAHAPHSGFFFY